MIVTIAGQNWSPLYRLKEKRKVVWRPLIDGVTMSSQLVQTHTEPAYM